MQFKGQRKEHPWYLEGKKVKGSYLGEYPCTGTVVESRVRYGGYVQHTVELDEAVIVKFDSTNPLRKKVHLLESDNEEHNELEEILE